MTPDSNNYGFFCDLETAKTMEYDKVDYYVVKVQKTYEVRRCSSATPNAIPPEYRPHPTSQEFQIRKTVSEESIQDDDNAPEKIPRFRKIITRLSRIPSDIYYSFMVCTVTASCVYLVMTI